MIHHVYIGLGTNLGNKAQNLATALRALQMRSIALLECSAFYGSKPWGFESDNDFLNAVALMQTTYSPLDLLEQTQAVEREMGRTHKSVDGHYADRVIDIDILLYDDLQIHLPAEAGQHGALTIPHPLMTKRDFVMRPLCEIAPSLIIPGQTLKVEQLVSAL